MAWLAVAKVENEVLRQSLIPALTQGALGRIMMQQVPYAWMGTLLAGIKGYNEKDQGWASHPLATVIWQVVNEEVRTNRQGQQSAPQGTNMAPQQRDEWCFLAAEGRRQWDTSCQETVKSAAKQGTRHSLAQ